MNQQFLQENDFPIISDNLKTSPGPVPTGKFFRFGLRTTIMIWFLGISLIPVAFVSLVGYNNAIESRISDFSTHLINVSLQGQQDLSKNFQNIAAGLKREAWSPQTMELLSSLVSQPSQAVPSWEGARELKALQKRSGVQDILITDQVGQVVFSCDSKSQLGMNLLQDKTVDPGLKSKISTALNTGQSTYFSFTNQTHQDNLTLGYQLEPVLGNDGTVRGLLIMEWGVDLFLKGWKRSNFTGVEMLAYVMNDNSQILVTSLQNAINTQGENPPSAEKSHEVRQYQGLGGETVLGFTEDLNVLGSTYYLVSEMPRGDVLAGLKGMGYSLLVVIVVVALLVILAGILLANRMVGPINQLGGVMQRVADGHEVWNLPQKGPREICQLTEMFQCMIRKLTDARELNERQYSQKRRQFELNEKLRGENSLEDLSQAVLQYLGEYFGAQLGVFYQIESRDKYRMVANFGINDTAQEMDHVILGQGLVGRVVAQKKIQVLRGLREDHLKVETGLVRSFVNNLVVAPIHFGDRALGVLELGLMEEVSPEKLEFLNLVSETIAVAISSARSRERVHRLLKETWSQSATLSKQQKELLESNRRFEIADQYKSEFLANMSHELRTPLNSMLIMSQVLAENRENNLSGDEVDSAKTINRAGADLLLLINDILDLSKVEAGKLDLQFTDYGLRSLLNDMSDLFEPLAEKQGLDFRTILDPDLPEMITTDPLRLTQILKNILNNAFKFTNSGSVTFRIEIPSADQLSEFQLAEDSSWLVFSVSDTGVGMNKDTREQIFEAFNQGDGSIGRRYGGSGLGLSISRKLSEMLGGHIHVESTQGEGSTFRLYMSVQPGENLLAEVIPESEVLESEPTEVDADFHLNNRRVLICEDDMRTVFQLSEVLDELGADVTLAPSWNQGVADGTSDHGFEFAIVSDRMADRPGPNSVSAWKQECGNPAYPILALVPPEEGLFCDGADLVGSRPLVKEEFLGLISQALNIETTLQK